MLTTFSSRAKAAALAAIVLFCAATPARTQPLETIRVASAADDDVTPVLYAQKTGMFAKAGLDVQLQRANNGAAIAAAVAGGSVDIGKSSLMALLAGHERGLGFVLVAPSGLYTSEDPTAMLVVPQNSPIHSGADLTGKTMPTTALRELMEIATQNWVDRNGGRSDSMKFIEMPGSSFLPALEDGRVDAATALGPILQSIMRTGKYRVVAHPMDAIARRFLIAAWFAKGDFASQHRSTIGRFASVLRTASLYTNTHHDETVALFASYSGMETSTVLAMRREVIAPALDPKEIQPLIEVAAKYNVIKKPFPAQELIFR
jgi:NitT/TauT family transport system substrate-binding protein